MNTTKRNMLTGLVVTALLATTWGLAPPTAHAKPIDEAQALRCQSISRRVAALAHRYHYAWEFGLSDADKQAIVSEYRDLLGQWRANGCDESFGTLPRLVPPSKIDAANQAATPGSPIVAPSNQP